MVMTVCYNCTFSEEATNIWRKNKNDKIKMQNHSIVSSLLMVIALVADFER